MKYFTIIIQKLADDTVANVIYAYDSEDAALEKLYSEMAYATNAKNLKGVNCLIMTENCSITKCEKWVNHSLVTDSVPEVTE